ncbi:MAG: hypothetical protein JWR34_740 [Mycobacterium sp.]|nr:hypothetical protein [Mycobacterium sp.]
MSSVRRPLTHVQTERGENKLNAYEHPSSTELAAALADPDGVPWALDHLDECIACRVRMSRVRRASGLLPASGDSLQRILGAVQPIPALFPDLVLPTDRSEVMAGEVWRAGSNEAVLVWVRKVFDDGVIDVIPVVLDTDLADQESILVPSDLSPLGTAVAVMISLRTHIDQRALINWIGTLDISAEVAEVIAAVREDRLPRGVAVGPPIVDDYDQRLEYRQALRDLLSELSPDTWHDASEVHDSTVAIETPAEWEESTPAEWAKNIASITAELALYLDGAQCRRTQPVGIPIDAGATAYSIMKVVYLDTAILLTAIQGQELVEFPADDAVAAICREFIRFEPDADAVAIAIPDLEWETLLFTTSHMREAVEAPSGMLVGPTPTIRGFALVETLCKHLEGAVTAWEITEPTESRLVATDLRNVAIQHAATARLEVVDQGRRAKQIAKRTAWETLSVELDDKVARFVTAVINHEPIDDAMKVLQLDREDD